MGIDLPVGCLGLTVGSSCAVKGERRSPKWYQDKGEQQYSGVPPRRLAKKCKLYGKLILRKIIEIVATSCHIENANSILAGAPPLTPLKDLTVLPDPLAGFKGPTSKGREGGKDQREEQRRGRG